MMIRRTMLLTGILAVSACLARTAEIRVSNVDVHDRLKAFDFAAAPGPLGPVRMVGARNGVYSGAVAVWAPDGSIKNLKCEASALTAAGGGVIPASAVRVRYALVADVSTATISVHGGAASSGLVFDTLVTEPAAEIRAPQDARGRKVLAGPVQPVWVTVRVPRDAAPGEYAGKLVMAADGLGNVEVPVKLKVAAWAVPNPADFRTYIGLVQSPPTLAMKYGVKEWSEEHWKLIEQSVRLLGEVGNKLVHIPVVERTQLGNDEGMVFWVKKSAGGYDYDFSAFDRYVKLMKQHCGSPEFVVLHVWHGQNWLAGDPKQENKVTVIDPKSGAHEHLQVPVFATPESEAFWKPFLLAARDHLAKEGLEGALCLGNLSDGGTHPDTQAMFNRIIPDVGWWRACHSVTMAAKPYPLKGGGRVVLQEHCYGMIIQDPAKKLPEIWNQRGPGAAFMREDKQHRRTPIQYRTAAERSLYCGKRGNAREALDLWVLDHKNDAGKTFRYSIENRWPHSCNMHGEIENPYLVQPGPKGPLPTIRFEMYREGIQEAEAMVVVAEAQAKSADRLGPELAKECKDIFVSRLNFCRPLMRKFTDTYPGWQESSARLYAAAARVAAKSGGK